MGAGCPPWYGEAKAYYEKELKKVKAKREVKLLEVQLLDEEIKTLEEEIAKCKE